MLWNSELPRESRRWFLGEVLARLGEDRPFSKWGAGQAQTRWRCRPGDVATIAFRPASFDGVVAFYMVNHLPERELAPTFERAFEWLRPGGRLMLSLLTLAAEDRVEEWLVGVPMFFGGYTLHSGERLLRETGFHLEVSEVRAEGVDFGYGPMETHWVIARKPGEDVP